MASVRDGLRTVHARFMGEIYRFIAKTFLLLDANVPKIIHKFLWGWATAKQAVSSRVSQ